MKKPTIQKEPKAPKETKGAKAKKKGVGHQEKGANSAEDAERRALFLVHKADYVKAKDRLGKAQSAIRALGKVIKADGFKLSQIKDSVLLDSPEGEEKIRAEIADRLLAAQWAGSILGQQLSLFLEPDRTPAVDIAYDQGVKASMENGSPKPPYDPSTPQHAEWLKGFHDDTERRTKAGIGKLDKPPADDAPPRASDMN